MPSPLSYLSFGRDGAPAPGTPGSTEAKWWTVSGEDAAASVQSICDRLRNAQSNRYTNLLIGDRLYSNAPVSAVNPGVPQQYRDRISFNLVASFTDTLVSKLAKNQPLPYFLTSGGDYRQRRRAKKLNKFVEGLFYEAQVFALGEAVMRDGVVQGDGILHIFERHGRVCVERVLPGEILVDEIQAAVGNPRQMHRVKIVDRDELAALFPDHKAAIKAANAVDTQITSAVVSDSIVVRESWHLPSSPTSKDGAHIITIDGAALTKREPWPHPWFPFSRFSYAPRLTGFWAQGAAERLRNIQLELNALKRVVQRALRLSGSFKVLMQAGSKIVKEQVNNEIGGTIEYVGAKPDYIITPAVAPEFFDEIERLKAEGYEQEGMSQMSAIGQKQPGVTAGVAIREVVDIESDRFTTTGKSQQRLFCDVAKKGLAMAREIARREGGYKVKSKAGRRYNEIDLKDVGLPEDFEAGEPECFSSSALRRDPAGRLQDVQEWMQAGLVSNREGKRLLDFPDLEQVESLQNAEEEWLTKILDAIVDDGEYTAPGPNDNLVLARELVLGYYAEGRAYGLDPERMEMLDRFLQQIGWLEKEALAAAAPPAPAGVPTGVPAAPPVSELLPSAPSAPAAPGLRVAA